MTLSENGVFHGTEVGRDAPPVPGRHPVLVISHGAGGNGGQFGWLASRLVQAGFVVVLPNHSGSTSGPARAAEALRIWERPQDISAVLDSLQGFPMVDPARIGALGYSAGGYTFLTLAGARVDPARLTSFCDRGGRGISDCAFFAQAGLDLHAQDLSPAAQDLRDAHIRFVLAVDPGIVETLTRQSLAAIDLPLLVINLGEEAKVPAPVHARRVAETVPGASYLVVPDAIHFSFLAECKPKGAAILAEEGEPDQLCSDAGGRTWAAIHADLLVVILPWVSNRW
ncbi:alpha/beta hydrolase family protein [Stagnihabitans tardus]|uniref:alpha/beta hydrolase family protein n=1 Tax=Stagnihabitans tardus TaxID=2699202 RepID=UPI00338D7002